MISSNSVRVVMPQNPYLERRISNAALPPSRISSTSSRTGLESMEAICFGAMRAWALPGLACRSEAEDEFGIAEDRDIGVVRREDELTAALFLPHNRHHALRDEAVVEIIFRLIDYKRRFRFKQQEQQNGGRLLTGRERLKRPANWPVPRLERCLTRSPLSQAIPTLRCA